MQPASNPHTLHANERHKFSLFFFSTLVLLLPTNTVLYAVSVV